MNYVESIKTSVRQDALSDDDADGNDDEDRDDPFDSDVTSEEDDDDDLMPERDTSQEAQQAGTACTGPAKPSWRASSRPWAP